MSAPLYVRDAGGRFAAHDWMFETGPLPYVDRPSTAELPPPPVPVERPNFTPVHAPRCPHGSFLRYAIRNCCREVTR